MTKEDLKNYQERAEKAKSILMEILDDMFMDNAPMKYISTLDTIIFKLETWQNRE